MAKIGIMGGTFDPIHNGHLLLAKQAKEEYRLDEVWFMPSGQPPHKKDHPVTAAKERCAMVRLAIDGIPGFVFSDMEIRRVGNTYTAQTLSELNETYPQHEFFFIIGADSLYEIETWYHPAEVLTQAVILVAKREYGETRKTVEEQAAFLHRRFKADIRLLHCDEIDISSGELRGRDGKGKKRYQYVPAQVEEYIELHGLYQEQTT